MDRTKESKTAYNYNDIFYFSSSTLKILKSIDYMTISIPIREIKPIQAINQTVIPIKRYFHDFFIARKYRRIKHALLEEKCLYKFTDIYFRESDNSKIELTYSPTALYLPQLMIKIHDVNSRIIRTFHSFLKKSNIPVNLSQLELSFDFYSDNQEETKEFLHRHLFLRYPRSSSFSIKTTHYTNDLRKDTKGMRIYPKRELLCTRMELVLKSRILKRYGIKFPLRKIDSLDLSHFFRFVDIDTEAVHRYLFKKTMKQITRFPERRKRFDGLADTHVRSYIDIITRNNYGEDDLMKKVRKLKRSLLKVPNHYRFLYPLPDFNKEFFKQVSEQEFLKPGRSILDNRFSERRDDQ